VGIEVADSHIIIQSST